MSSNFELENSINNELYYIIEEIFLGFEIEKNTCYCDNINFAIDGLKECREEFLNICKVKYPEYMNSYNFQKHYLDTLLRSMAFVFWCDIHKQFSYNNFIDLIILTHKNILNQDYIQDIKNKLSVSFEKYNKYGLS